MSSVLVPRSCCTHPCRRTEARRGDLQGAAALQARQRTRRPRQTTAAQLTKPAAFTPSALARAQGPPADLRRRLPARTRRAFGSGCVYGDPNGAVTIALLGDSHAAQWFPPLERIALDRHWRLVVETKQGCTPASVLVYNSGLLKRAYTECSTWRTAALARLVKERPQFVLTSGNFGNIVVQNGKRLDDADSVAATNAGMAATLKQLTGVGSEGPGASGHATARVRRTRLRLQRRPEPGEVRAPTARRPVRRVDRRGAGAAKQVKGAEYVDLDTSVCPSDPCTPIIGNVWSIATPTT